VYRIEKIKKGRSSEERAVEPLLILIESDNKEMHEGRFKFNVEKYRRLFIA
jgi:hypothetical protein